MALTIPPEAFELSAWAKRAGVDDPLPYLRDLALIDTDTLRSVGAGVWGLNDVSGTWPDGGYSPARINLEEEARQLLTQLGRLSPGWRDDAYEAFKSHMMALVQQMEVTAAQFSTVGEVLVSLADEFELRWFEVVGFVVSAAGLLVGIIGLITAATTWWTGAGGVAGVILAVVGAVLAAVGLAISYLAAALPRLEELAEATERLDRVVPNMRWVDPQVG